MTDRFEEDLGKHVYVTLAQIKDYLSISSNTQDARLSNIINYATGVIEHYIGQEIVANNYVEIFDGGKSSVFVNRLPLNNVYQVTEFNGVEDVTLADCTTIGRPINTADDDLTITFVNNAHITSRIKRFGKSALELGVSDYIFSGTVPEQFRFEESDFTIEMFVRVDEPTIQDNVLFAINTDSSNYLQFRLANQYGLAFEANIAGTPTIVQGANSSIETQQFAKRRWAHVAVSRDLENERLYLHYNGNTVANAFYEVSNHTFTSNVQIGTTFKGYMDEIRVSSKSLYSTNFIPPSYRFRPDNDTVLLIHFDEKDKATVAKDVHAEPNEYMFSRDSGEITRDVGAIGVRGTYPTIRNSYPALTLSGPPAFQPYPSGVKVEYRAGYELGSVPYDLQLATLDFIKLLYKQDQEKKGFSFEGERGDSFPLAGNFPPHIRRILDLYRIIV
jgi:hypothetical protein